MQRTDFSSLNTPTKVFARNYLDQEQRIRKGTQENNGLGKELYQEQRIRKGTQENNGLGKDWEEDQGQSGHQLMLVINAYQIDDLI